MGGLLKKILRSLRLSRPASPRRKLAGMLGNPEQRTPSEWRAWRKATTLRVKELLANKKAVVAARELSRALLQDPDFPEFQSLLKEAAALKLKRDAKAGKPDPWGDLPPDLKEQALELEGFQLYVEEVEQLLDQAGFAAVAAPPVTTKTKAKAPTAGRSPSR